MTDKLWKASERAIAKAIGGARIPVNGRGNTSDIAHPRFAIECKSRATLPTWLLEAVGQAKRAVSSDQLPIVVLHGRGNKHSNDLVVLTLRDFQSLSGIHEVDPHS